MSETLQTVETAETSQNRQQLKTALLDLGKSDYEKVRTELIDRLGYDQFRTMQNDIFKEIGTIKSENS